MISLNNFWTYWLDEATLIFWILGHDRQILFWERLVTPGSPRDLEFPVYKVLGLDCLLFFFCCVWPDFMLHSSKPGWMPPCLDPGFGAAGRYHFPAASLCQHYTTVPADLLPSYIRDTLFDGGEICAWMSAGAGSYKVLRDRLYLCKAI